MFKNKLTIVQYQKIQKILPKQRRKGKPEKPPPPPKKRANWIGQILHRTAI